VQGQRALQRSGFLLRFTISPRAPQARGPSGDRAPADPRSSV